MSGVRVRPGNLQIGAWIPIPHISPQNADVSVTRDNDGLPSRLPRPVTCGSARGSRASLESRLLGSERGRQASTGKAKENAPGTYSRLLRFSNFGARQDQGTRMVPECDARIGRMAFL